MATHVSSRLVRRKHIHNLRREIIALLNLGYQLWWTTLTASDYGVPQHRSRVILVAAKNGLTLPHYPSRSHNCAEDALEQGLRANITVRDAIEDLNFDNPRVDSGGINPKFLPVDTTQTVLSAFVKRLRRVRASGSTAPLYITHHSTGRQRNSEKYAEFPSPDWDEPSRTVLTSPSNRWDSLHPG